MSSYQATVQLDSKSGERRFWLIGAETAKVIVEYDPESAMTCDSRGINAFDSELEGLYLDEPLADDNYIAEYDSEVWEAEQRSQALQNS